MISGLNYNFSFLFVCFFSSMLFWGITVEPRKETTMLNEDQVEFQSVDREFP